MQRRARRAPDRGTRTRYGRLERAVARLTLAVFLTSGAAGPVGADATDTVLGPAETTVGNGEFTVNTDTHTEYTQHSQNAVVDWGVDIQQGADHTLGYRQQEGYAVLNRSPGVRASNFYGTVECDATCIFANEKGVYFHDGSHIDVGQLIVAAGRITADDFLAGDYVFGDLLGEVINHGHMRGDAITLLGQRVANFGHVETPDGSFAMLAGSRIRLRDHDSPIVIESPVAAVEGAATGGSPFGDTPAVENAGTIDAGNGSVRLAAGDMLSFAIRQSGEIRAREIVLEGGDDGLVEVGGTLDASAPDPGQVGGTIDVLGDYVAIVEDAVLDASGSAGGGRIRVGGDRLGRGDVRTARGTYVHPNAELRADAIDDGDGGEVIVYAEDTAQVYGKISAQGGVDGGHGGFVETSGRRYIDVRRAPLVGPRSGSPLDRAGEWLIDPNNIEIVESMCGAAPECLDDGLSNENLQNPEFVATGPILRPTVDDSKITASLIAEALEGGANVTIFTQTIAEVQGEQVGDITVNADILLDEEDAPGPGTNVTLSLFASQNIVINREIRVIRRDPGTPGQPRGASDLQLDLLFVSGDNGQFQAPAPVDQTPNNFLGEIDIRANLDTAGGNVTLQGLGVKTAAGTSLVTNGGSLQVTSAAGDVVFRGAIDTSTDVINELTGTFLDGGDIDMDNQASRVPSTGALDSPTNTTGGSIEFFGDVTTGGGDLDVTALGGESQTSGLRVASTISTGGGAVILRALEQTLAPVTVADVAQTGGGRIVIEEGAVVESGGGDIDVGVADIATLLPGAREIVMNGRIDSQVYDDATGMPDVTERGGFVFFNTVGPTAKVLMGEGATAGPTIVTNGGRVESFGDGSFRMVDGTIDTRMGQPFAERSEDLAIDSTILLQHDDGVTIRSSGPMSSTLAAEESVTIVAGADGVGDLIFEEDTGASAEITADRITLTAGDGATQSGATGARVVLGNTRFAISGLDPMADTSFTLQQDADLATSGVVGNLTTSGYLGDLDTVGLAAWDGTIDLTEPDLFQADGLGLELAAGRAVVASSPTNPTIPPSGPPLESLDITIVDAFTLDASLADFITGTAKNLSIAAGAAADPDDPSLLVQGSADAGMPMDLVAGESLTLQGGREGTGDLAFAGNTRLGAQDITLRAGNGDSVGTSRVRPDGLPGLAFDDGATSPGPLTAFTIRQDAAITDDVIPDPAQFQDGVAGVDYTLRTDGAGSAITLDSPGAARLRDTDLSLFANGAIDLTALSDQELVVQSLQIGGIGSFSYTADHNDKFRFSDQGSSRTLVIRAGLGGTGLLSFASGLTITADEIRLVAGDGVGGGGSGSLAGSSISLQPFDGGAAPIFRKDANNGPDRFVFRQDVAIAENDLPDLNSHFAGNAPNKLAIRSDDQNITFDSFTSTPLLVAGNQVVLSAPIITFDRRDGEDLVLDDLFDDGSGQTPGSVQLRGDNIVWSATNEGLDPNKVPEVRPGDTVRIAAFDGPDPDDPFESPPAAFDFGEVIDEAPLLLIAFQDGSIDSSNLIGLDQIGTGLARPALNRYELTSNFGSITITPGDVTQTSVLPEDQADLVLNLAGLDEGLGSRTVNFSDPTEAGFVLNSLFVINPFDWKIENTAPGTSSLSITATDFMDLLAAVSNTGNMTFGSNVTLQSRAIVLQAGDDPQQPLRTLASAPVDPLPVVDTTGLKLVFEDTSDDLDGTVLRIFQHGKFLDTAPATPLDGESQIIDPSQIFFLDSMSMEVPPASVPGDSPLLGEMQLSSFSSDIEITSFGNGVENFPTTDLTLVAGSGGATGGTVTIGQTDNSDLNLSVDWVEQPPGSGNFVAVRTFDEFAIFAKNIDLSTNGAGVIRARGPNLLLLGPVVGTDVQGNPIFNSPEAITFSQDTVGFNELDDVTDCSSGCLPEAFQLGPTLTSGIDYTLEARNAGIVVNDALTAKVWGSDLKLLANNPGGPGVFDVEIDISSKRDLDLFLNSFTVGDSASSGTTILLRANAGDAFEDLTIVTALSQTYNGAVTLDNPQDGTIELVGDVVEFTETVDKNDPNGFANLVVGVVTEARFNGNVGATQALDRLRLNFDPAAVASSTVRFGSEAGGNDTTVDATTIEFFAVSNAATDTIVPRAPLTSTIYKRNGNLTFTADTFTMGVGEKLTVQGDLDIRVIDTATLSDLSALDIRVGSQGGAPPTIVLQRRAPGSYLARNGSVQPDGGLDFVANTIAFDGNIVLTGAGRDPIYGLADPRTAPLFMRGFSVLAAQQSGLPLTPSDFDWAVSNVLPDLHPEGASRDDPSSMFFAEDLVPTPDAWQGDPWMPWQRSQLSDLFVLARPLDRAEWSRWLDDAAVIDDVGRDLQAWDGRPLPVAAQRLDGEGAKHAVQLFEQIFGADGGNVEHLRRTLRRAVDQYRRNTGAQRVVGFELRRFVKNRPSSLFQAHQVLEDLDTLFARHRALGLTPGEYRPIQARWLAAIRPEGITTRELAEAVQPSRYVRGSDVLDIFGD